VRRIRTKSHSLDAFSLVAGAVFAVLGVLVAVDIDASREIDPRVLLAVLLVGLGLAGVFGSLDWSRSHASTSDAAPDDDDSDLPVPPTPSPPEEEQP